MCVTGDELLVLSLVKEQKKPRKVYIISRHEGFIQYIKEIFPFAEVIEHIENPKQIQKHSIVIGNIPIDIIDILINERQCKVFLAYFDIDRFTLKEYFEKYKGNFPYEFVKKYVKFRYVRQIEVKDKLTIEDIASSFVR